jgi:hypothetical protein
MSKGKYKRKQHHRQTQTQQNPIKALFLNKERNPETESKDSTERQDKAKKGNKRWMRFWKFLQRSSPTDWLLSVFTFVLAFYAIRQAFITGNQLDVMRKEERAWIDVASPLLTKDDMVVGVGFRYWR